MAQSAIGTCEICNKAKGIDFCQECQQLFCNNCKLMHFRMKISRNHTFRDVDQPEVKLTLCEEHEWPYILFCETCSSLICTKCAYKNHISHKIEEITVEKISEQQNKVSEQLERCSKNIKERQRDASEVKGQMQNNGKDYIELREEINSRGKTIKSYVDEVVVSLTIQVLETEQTQQQTGNAFIDQIQKVDKKISELKLEQNKITEERSGVALLKSLQNFESDNNSFMFKIPCMPELNKLLFSDRPTKNELKLKTQELFGNLDCGFESEYYESDSDTE
ncbi:unnamed protein product [Mytilus edulis]|uniref:B box-type domain-containing protein n=1 Tax=Mytilus edulis TaxID=6550 RepID=A0A8S3QLT0_MYTED|nr:unnamed protein product [Mytilus edulis]